MTAYGGFVAGDGDARRHEPAALEWLSAGTVISHRLGTPDTTASVHPRKFTTAIMRAAQQHGAQVRPGQVTGLVRRRAEAIVTGLEVDGSVVEADATVIAMGPWSMLAAEWAPLPQVFGQQSPSLVYDTGTDVSADALFLEFRDASGDELTVEVFPRADGSTHVCAFSGAAPLPPVRQRRFRPPWPARLRRRRARRRRAAGAQAAVTGTGRRAPGTQPPPWPPPSSTRERPRARGGRARDRRRSR